MKTSVALCTFNGERFIEEQLLSLFSQTVPIDEIVIIDDHSTDSTPDIIQNLITSNVAVNIRFASNIKNFGFIKNFENAICECSGEVVFLCDQDDVWHKDKIKIYLEEFAKNPSCLLLFSNAYIIDQDGEVLHKSLWEWVIFNKNKCHINQLLNKNYITGATMAFRKALVNHCTPFDEKIVHDYWLALNSICLGTVNCINKKMISYRLHQQNTLGLKRSRKSSKAMFYLKLLVHLLKVFRCKKTKLCVKGLQQKYYIVNKLYNKYLDDEPINQNLYLIINNVKTYLEKRVVADYNSSFFFLNLIFQDIIKWNYWKYDNGLRSIDRDLVNLIKNRL